jgi:N-acyl amino acid synthase of PEP-CTERM/exosortase system
MITGGFPGWKRGIFRRGKEIKGLRGGVHRYAAQANPRIDAATAEKNRFRTETNLEGKPVKRFEFREVAREDPRFREVLALRYQVYCAERGFENPEDFPDGLERDEFDDSSIHFAAIHRPTGRVVGTVRLVLPAAARLPGEKFFNIRATVAGFDRMNVGEISRLALTKRYCRELQRNLRNGSGEIVHGLFRCLALESGRLGLTHLYAVMSRGLPVLLAKNRIHFNRVGPERAYHGLRAPYFGAIEELVASDHVLYNLYRTLLPVSKVA